MRRLTQVPGREDRLRHLEVLPAREAVHADWPEWVPDDVRGVRRDDLVAPRTGDALGGEGPPYVVRDPLRPVLVHRLAGGQHLEVAEPVLAPRDLREATYERLHRRQHVGTGGTHLGSLTNGDDSAGDEALEEKCWGHPAKPVGLVV